MSSEPLPRLDELEPKDRTPHRRSRWKRTAMIAAGLVFAIGGATMTFAMPESSERSQDSAGEARTSASERDARPQLEPTALDEPEPTASKPHPPEPEPSSKAAEPAVTPEDPESRTEDPTPVEDPNLNRARTALDDGRAKTSYALASRSFEQRPTKAAVVLMVEASCRLDLRDRARAAYITLPLSARAAIRETCSELGIELGA